MSVYESSVMGSNRFCLSAEKRTVMLVDDEPDELRMLSSILSAEGYRTSAFRKGGLAIAAALSDPPDLLLLNMQMQGMDSYEVYRAIRTDQRTRTIPVLFISSSSTPKDIAERFGAVDCITKPFKEQDMLARVKSRIRPRQTYADLMRENEALRELVQKREAFAQMLVHDMRMPIQLILGNLECFASAQSGNVPEVGIDCLRQAVHASYQLGRMVAAIVDAGRIESGRLTLETVGISSEKIFRLAQDLSVPVTARGRIRMDAVAGWPIAKADEELCVRMISNLLDNALKYSAANSDILCSAHAEGEAVKFIVQSRGHEIPSYVQAHIFEKYAFSRPLAGQHRFSTGLGLAFCRLAVEAQGGRIGVRSTPSGLNSFWFTLPAFTCS